MRDSFLVILIISILIASLGVLTIYSSTHQKGGEFWKTIYQRQILWVILGLVLFLGFSHLSYRRLWDWTYFLYGVSIFLLCLVIALGVARLGAQRWLKIVWFQIQPSEFAKLIMVVFLARYFSRKSVDDISLLSTKFGIFRGLILPFLFVAIPAVLIVEQPHLGSAVLLFLIFISFLYLTGVKLRYIVILFLIAVLVLPVVWGALHGYQKERLLVFMNPNIDPLGAGYTIIHSKIAIGSGGLFGKGWLSGTQSQLRFLPEAHTDFIFAAFAEEWGFLGSCILLVLYSLLIRQAIVIAQRTRDHFGKLLAFGIGLMLTLQIFVNMAMNLGMVPVVGLPLPLMSYGGSSMLITFISLGILVSIDRRRSVF
ncbi:MAG: rod shape-determining protein RodA [Candidatus Omnitrophica bacterium]|nr:rod shape-determining protein RodA [Candidatus Omnitrophota bacterium]